jgi:hypothetical protein
VVFGILLSRRCPWFAPGSTTKLLPISTWASRLGADYTLYPLAALFYFYGKPADNPRARDTARIGIEALADAEITVNILKTVTQRPRPETKTPISLSGAAEIHSRPDIPFRRLHLHESLLWSLTRTEQYQFSRTAWPLSYLLRGSLAEGTHPQMRLSDRLWVFSSVITCTGTTMPLRKNPRHSCGSPIM